MFKTFNLGDVCSIESGSRGKGGASTLGIPSIGGEQISSAGYILTEKMKYITEEHFKKMKQGILKPGDILLVKDGATTGKCAFYRNEYKEAAVNEHVFILRANNIILPRLLYYVISSDKFQSKIKSSIKGIIGGINLSIKNLEIYIPDTLAEQQEIVQVLDTMSDIIRLREECISHAQALIPALFREMFGKIERNTRLNSIISLEYGKALKAENRNSEGEYPVYGSNGIVGYHDSYIVEGQTIIVGRKGSCGKLNLTQKSCFPIDTCFYIKQKTPVNWYYLFYALQELNVENMLKDAVIPGINRNDYLRNSIRLAPTSEQEQFAQKAIEIESYIKEQQEELENAKQMFQSLLHHAFTGELTKHKTYGVSSEK